MPASQSCPTLCDPMDCGPPGSSVRGIFPGKNAGVDSHSLLQGIFPTQGLNPRLPHWQADSLPLSCQGSPQASWEATKQLSLAPHPHLQALVPGTLSWGKAAVCPAPSILAWKATHIPGRLWGPKMGREPPGGSVPPRGVRGGAGEVQSPARGHT